MSKEKQNHRTTLRIRECARAPVWNALKFAAIKAGKTYNETVVQALKETFGEIEDLSKLEVHP